MSSYRATPVSSSRKLLALKFIQDFWAKHGESPSLREVAAAIGADDATAALRIVRQLDAEGKVVYIPNRRRGILLPDEIDRISTDDALRVLMRRGWTVNGNELAPAALLADAA